MNFFESKHLRLSFYRTYNGNNTFFQPNIAVNQGLPMTRGTGAGVGGESMSSSSSMPPQMVCL